MLKKVLLVEDNATDALLLRKAFQRAGLNDVLHQSLDANEAYEWLSTRLESGRSLPDLILVDLNLPGESGFEMISKIKSLKKLEDIPIVVFSGSTESGDMQRANELGSAWYFVKQASPRDLDFIVKALQQLCKDQT